MYGLGRGSLYDTFGDKHSLYLAALDRYCSLTLEQIAPSQQQPASLQETLESLFQSYIDILVSDPARRGCFLVNASIELASHDPEVLKRVQSANQSTEEVFYLLLIKAQAAGELAWTHNPHQLAHFLLGTLISIRILARARADREVLQDIAKTALLAIR
jgi:TetR/AcrR family transcriptional regulator, transcriptional repressor for nem operon